MQEVQEVRIENTQIDASIKRYDDRQYVRSLLNNTLQIGQNWLRVKSITEKYVEIHEFQRGLFQKHRRYSLSEAADYIRYRKEIMSVSTSEKIDESLQSYEWKSLNNTINDIKFDIESQIYLEKLESQFADTISVQWFDSSIIIGFENGQELSIIFRRESSLRPFAISLPCGLTQLVLDEDFRRYDFCHRIAALVMTSSDRSNSSCKFIANLVRFIDISQRFSAIEIVQPVIKTPAEHQRVLHWIQNSEVGEPLILNMGVFGMNGHVYRRSIKIEKITRVRTKIQVIAWSNTDAEKIEWSSWISKITHQLTDNTNQILQIRTAFIID